MLGTGASLVSWERCALNFGQQIAVASFGLCFKSVGVSWKCHEWEELCWRRYLLGVTHVPLQPSLPLSHLWLHVPEMLTGMKSQTSQHHQARREARSSVLSLRPRRVILPWLQGNAVNSFLSAVSTATSVVTNKHTQDPSNELSNSPEEDKN